MRSLFRTTTVVLVFAVTLLLALPAHAAPVHRTPATPPAASLAAGWSALWTGLTHLLAPVSSTADFGSKPSSMSQPVQPRTMGTTNGGSCIDPDGACLN